MSLPFPDINPVALDLGTIPVLDLTIQIRWYALAYLTGFLAGWFYARRLNRLYGAKGVLDTVIDDFMTWAILGVVLGGRIGYVLFYNLPHYLDHPLAALAVWEGGMSFHGGAIGVILAIILFAWHRGLNMFRLADIVCAVVPIGLFFGRLSNFVNGELYGRATDLPWGVVFPESDGAPRHPSQIYEALGEGLILFIVLAILMRVPAVRDRPGIVSAVFLAGYASVRFLVEFVREPDVQLGILPFGLTMGQTLCLPMLAGAALVVGLGCRTWSRA